MTRDCFPPCIRHWSPSTTEVNKLHIASCSHSAGNQPIHRTDKKLWDLAAKVFCEMMGMNKMTSPVIILASYWVLSGATVAQDGQKYGNIGINDKIFTDNITFESTATSAVQCAVQCNQQDSCVTFTFHQNTCRGHGIPMSTCSATLSTPGARAFSRKGKLKVADRCEGTGVIRLRDTSLGLDTDVYCDDDWLVFQKRQDGCVDFFRNWDNYTDGFGDANGEYWLGLESLHRITRTPVSYELRVDLMSFNGTNASVVYSNFTVGPAADNYALKFDSFLGGTTGDSLLKHRDMQFSTLDADHDISALNCAEKWKGAWWYRKCLQSNLNGIYKPNRTEGQDGIFWKNFDGWYALQSCQMMIRPAVN